MRIGIIGMGWVGTSVAISTLHSGLARELLLYDVKTELAEGEAMDLAHGSSFYSRASVRVASMREMRDCDAVVIAAGRGGNAKQTRLQLLQDNAQIMRDIARELEGCRGIVIVVTNPVDVLTRVVQQESGLPPARVIGTGTMLDTARLRHTLGDLLELEPRSIHANVIGEHGDSEVVLFSCAQVGGRPLRDWPDWSPDREADIVTEVRRAAYEIIRRKGATNHAIGLVTTALMRWALRGERRVLTVSRVQEGACGLHGVALSLPTIVGADGATEVIVPNMDRAEHEGLLRSAEVLESAWRELT